MSVASFVEAPGEHNAGLLGALGLAPAKIDALEADGIIGSSLVKEA